MTTRSMTMMMTLTLLTACGGSTAGTSGVSAPVTVVTAPTPVVTPVPAPTPTPAATQPKVEAMPGYGRPCDDFTSNITSYTISATMRIARDFGSSTTPDAYSYSAPQAKLENYSEGMVFSFDAKSRALSTSGIGYSAFTFGSKDVVDVQSTKITYRDGYRSLVLTCDVGSSMSFHRYSSDLNNPTVSDAPTIYRSQIAGVPTGWPSELSTGTYASNLTLQTFRTAVTDPTRRTQTLVSTTPGRLSFDVATGNITGTITIGGEEPFDLKVEALVSRGLTALIGTVTASNGAKGKIIGGFYGANGRQLGYVTTFQKDGQDYVGSGFGTRE